MVNFNEDSFAVAESAGQVNMSLRINGQFFVPVWAMVEISDWTATGELCKACTGEKYCAPLFAYICACFTQA